MAGGRDETRVLHVGHGVLVDAVRLQRDAMFRVIIGIGTGAIGPHDELSRGDRHHGIELLPLFGRQKRFDLGHCIGGRNLGLIFVFLVTQHILAGRADVLMLVFQIVGRLGAHVGHAVGAQPHDMDGATEHRERRAGHQRRVEKTLAFGAILRGQRRAGNMDAAHQRS